MCGILGFIDSPWAAQVRPAVATLRSRGPDAESVLDLGEAVFAHTRLAVIVAGGIRRRFKTQHQRIEKLRDWRVRCPDKKDPGLSARAKCPAVMVRPSCRICDEPTETIKDGWTRLLAPVMLCASVSVVGAAFVQLATPTDFQAAKWWRNRLAGFVRKLTKSRPLATSSEVSPKFATARTQKPDGRAMNAVAGKNTERAKNGNSLENLPKNVTSAEFCGIFPHYQIPSRAVTEKAMAGHGWSALAGATNLSS